MFTGAPKEEATKGMLAEHAALHWDTKVLGARVGRRLSARRVRVVTSPHVTSPLHACCALSPTSWSRP